LVAHVLIGKPVPTFPGHALGGGHHVIRLLEEFAFPAIVLDAFSRCGRCGALERHLQASLVTAALGMALTARRPAHGSLIHPKFDSDPQFSTNPSRIRLRPQFSHRSPNHNCLMTERFGQS